MKIRLMQCIYDNSNVGSTVIHLAILALLYFVAIMAGGWSGFAALTVLIALFQIGIDDPDTHF